MITKEQALTANEFHENGCKRIQGLRGGVKTTIFRWRRNGKTQTWKTRPEAWRIPIKYGLKGYGVLTDTDANLFHAVEDCPIENPVNLANMNVTVL